MEITKDSVYKAKYLIILCVLVLAACNMKTYILLDKITSVPSDTSVYRNKSKFDVSLLQVIDTAVVYEEYEVERSARRVYCVLRFYSNGYFNSFFVSKGEVLLPEQFDPNYSGQRGVYYKENDKIRYDLFAPIDELYHLGKISGTLTFSGDTLFMKRDDVRGINKMTYSVEIYIKRKLPPKYLQYKANW